jgi:hypothetical protein
MLNGEDEILTCINATANFYRSNAVSQLEQSGSSNCLLEWITKIQNLFEQDKDASCFINQKLAEQKKKKILILCEFTEQVYRNVEKRIKDKARKRFPNGFPWWEIES